MRISFLSLLLVGLFTLSAEASLVYPGVVNEWQDSDYETFFNLDGSFIEVTLPSGAIQKVPTVTLGDLFAGMWEVDKVKSTVAGGPISDGDYTAAFLVKVAGTDLPFFTDTTYPDEFSYVPTLATEDLSIFGLGVVDPWVALMGVARISLDSMAKVYDNSVPPPLQPTPANGSIVDEITQATDGTFLFEAGFTGRDGDDEFWYSASDGATGLDSKVIYVASLNVTADGAWTSSALAPHNWLDVDSHITSDEGDLWPTVGTGETTSQFQLAGSVSDVVEGVDLPVNTNTRIFIKPVPEPSTMLIWGALGLLGLAAARRRRNAA